MSITQMSYKCDECKDEGFIYYEKEDRFGNKRLVAKECLCRIQANNEKRIKSANVSELFKVCNFLNYKETTDEQARVKALCVSFYNDVRNDMEDKATALLLLGQVGSGKTHLAVATLNNLIANSFNCLYSNYKDLVRYLSQIALDKDAYNSEIQKYIKADILLIDDLFKSRNSSEITTAQLNYIYEIINQRYVNNKITIVTSEKNIEQLLKIDEAIASRIIQMTKKKYIVDMNNIKNQRMI